MIVTCPQCQQKYRIDQSRFHEGVKFLRCQGCGQTFRFSPTPPETATTESGLLEITCPGCNKLYKIDKSLLTPEVSSIPCKTCGLLVPIETESISQPDEIISDAQTVDIQPEILSWTSSSDLRDGRPKKIKKIIFYAVTAIILLIIIAGAYLGFHLFFKKKGGSLILGKTSQKAMGITPDSGPHPLIYLNTNLALLRKVIEDHVSAENKSFGYQIITAIYDSLSPERGSLFLYPEPEYQFLPVLLVHSKDIDGWKGSVIKKAILNRFLEPSAEGTYRIKSEAIAGRVTGDFPMDIYRVWFFKKSAVLGPQTLSHIWKNGTDALTFSGVARFADLVDKPGGLAVVSFRTADIRNGWEKSLTEPLKQDADPQVGMVAGAVERFLSNLTEPFKQINALAVGFKFSGEKERMLSYAQEFRKGVDGARVYKHLQDGAWENLDTEGLILSLLELLNDERLASTINFENNRLSIDLTWSEEDDESILQSLAQATFGYLFTPSMSHGKLIEDPVETRYTNAPDLIPQVDVAKIRGVIQQAIKNSLFPGHYWRHGDNPRVTLELDPIDLPNACIAELTYEIIRIGVPGKRNVLRKEDNPVKQAIGSSISLPVLKGTPSEVLGNAKIRFHITVPIKLQIFEFKSDAAKGSIKKADDLSVKLSQIEKDIASVVFRGGKSCHLYAFDKTGRALTRLESMGSSASKFSRFQGVIDTLKVIIVREALEHSFEVEVDLNNGKELELPAIPDHSVPVRHDRQPLFAYTDFTQQDLHDLAVMWSNDKTLSLTLPKSPFYGEAKWEAHFFDNDKPALFTWDPVEMSDKFFVYFRNPLTKIPAAAFGKVRVELYAEIQRLTFSKKSGNGRTVKRLPSGQKVVVTFEKNQINYSVGTSKVLQIAAYDTRGKRLRTGKYAVSSESGQIHRFWGQPVTVVMDIAAQKIVRTIPFDLQTAPVNRAAYKSHKQSIDHQREIFRTLQAIDHSRKKNYSGYGETLAGLFYIYRKSQTPMMLIDKAIAHSDPAGRARYGFELKPYRGYHFSYLSGTEQDGIKTDYQRQAQEKIFKWQKGSFKTKPYYQRPDMVAYPVDKTQPTFISVGDEVYMKYLNGSELKYIPQNIHTSDWAKVRFISD